MSEFLRMTDTRLGELLAQGAVGVLPTDTVYGLVCDASHAAAVARLYALKSRERKPGTMIAANTAQVCALGVSVQDVQRAKCFWPGVSVVLSLIGDRAYLHQGLGDIAIRIVAQEDLVELLEKTGPLLTSSANLPGELPANTLDEARTYFGDAVDFYVDGGDLSDRQSSTLVCLRDGNVEVIRQGSIFVTEVGRV